MLISFYYPVFYMKTEISAGGVVVYNQAGTWYVILLKDMKSNWTFPKGTIEPKETPQVAAKREVSEEVGLKGMSLIKPLGFTQYLFKRGELIKKIVHYFLFLSAKKTHLIPQTEEGVSEAKWILLSKAIDIVGYPKTNKLLLEKAKQILENTEKLQRI